VAMLWNYLVVPLYMEGITREAITPLLLSAFLPFNLISNGLNAAITLIVYKHVKKALQSARLLDYNFTEEANPSRISIGVVMAAIFIVITCVLWIIVL